MDTRLKAAVAAGVLSTGTARRTTLAARLADAYFRGRGDLRAALVSGQDLAEMMGLSRAAVQKHVHHLQSLGFAVNSVRGRGYRLERPFFDLVAAEAVLPLLLGTAEGQVAASEPSSRRAASSDLTPEGLPPVGLPYAYLEQCGSTNLVLREKVAPRREAARPTARDLAAGRPGILDPPSGMLVVTDAQTAGRGRLDRIWSSRPGEDLTFSVLLRPSLAPGQAHLLSLAAGLTVAEVLETLAGFQGKATVKWPNDVLLGEKKVCGILVEGSMDAERLHWVVVGIGLNVNSVGSTLMADATPEEVAAWGGRPRPVSLREHLGREVPRAPLLVALLEGLGRRWAGLDDRGSTWAEVLGRLESRDALAGRMVEIARAAGPPEPAVVGVAAGLGPAGQLLVRRASGEVVEVFAGDVTVRALPEGKSGAWHPARP